MKPNISTLTYNNEKTVGPQGAHLLSGLHEQGRSIFTLQEAQELLPRSRHLEPLLASLVRRGLLTRLRPGLYQIVPYEIGHGSEYLGNPYLVAKELVQFQRGHSLNEQQYPYFLSHASAMDLHQITTQPQLIVYVTTPRVIRPIHILGTEFRFVQCRPVHFFGATEKWVTKQKKVWVSDLERTLLDGLTFPQYCGGLTEIAKAISIKKDQIQATKLVAYALKFKVGAVIRRLGFLMELFKLGTEGERELLQKELTATYHRLDPSLPAEGKFLARWRLQLNILPEELQSVGGT